MARRGENIRKRKDGRWEGRYIKGYSENGKAIYKSVYAPNYNGCRQKLLNEKAECKQSDTFKSDYSKNANFTDILKDWLESIRVNAKYSTYVKYRNAVQNHILPEFGGIRLKEISIARVNGFLLEKSLAGRLDHKGGLSDSTVNILYIILTSALIFATGNNSPLGKYKFKPTQKADPEICILSKAEQTQLEQVLLNDIDYSKLGVLICLYTGIRLGEACALRGEDIDRENGIIKIRRTVQRVQVFDEDSGTKTKLMIDVPKSKASVRDIPLHPFIIKMLDEQFSNYKNGYVITGTTSLLDPRTYQYRFKSYLKAAGIKDIHFHAVRASFATNCVEAGVDVKSLSSILGHNVNITLSKYVHTDIEMKRRQIEKLNIFNGQDWGKENLKSA